MISVVTHGLCQVDQFDRTKYMEEFYYTTTPWEGDLWDGWKEIIKCQKTDGCCTTIYQYNHIAIPLLIKASVGTMVWGMSGWIV